jgi:hypothetical protein
VYSGSDIVFILEQLIGIAFVIKGKLGESLFVIYSTHYTGKEIYIKEVMLLTISFKMF